MQPLNKITHKLNLFFHEISFSFSNFILSKRSLLWDLKSEEGSNLNLYCGSLLTQSILTETLRKYDRKVSATEFRIYHVI